MRITRRTFLQGSAAVIAVAVLPPIIAKLRGDSYSPRPRAAVYGYDEFTGQNVWTVGVEDDA